MKKMNCIVIRTKGYILRGKMNQRKCNQSTSCSLVEYSVLNVPPKGVYISKQASKVDLFLSASPTWMSVLAFSFFWLPNCAPSPSDSHRSHACMATHTPTLPILVAVCTGPPESWQRDLTSPPIISNSRPCLVSSKILKLYKISRYIEFFNAYMKY